MSLEFLNQTPTAAFRKLERDLFLLNPKIDLKKYKMLTPARLGEAIAVLKGKTAKIVENSTYGSWLKNENYIQADILREALEFLLSHKGRFMCMPTVLDSPIIALIFAMTY